MCCRLLVAPRDKKSRRSYQCTEFAADLHLVFGIDTHNDAVTLILLSLQKSYGSSAMPTISLQQLVKFLMS